MFRFKFKKHEKKAVFIFVTVLIATLIFYGGFRFGETKRKPIFLAGEDQLPNADFSLFWDVLDMVKRKYVGIGEIKDEEFLHGAIKGVVGALDDPYSNYFEPEDATKLNQDLSGSFGGIGAEIGIRSDQLIIVAPLKGNPAEATGLKAGDKILKVDDTFTNNLTVDRAVKLIRGEPGTEVKLLILRNGWEEAKEFKIIRAEIVVPTLDSEIKELDGKRVAYIQLYNFNANAPELFYRAAFDVLFKNLDGIVLDLRNNPGGFLEVATNIAGWFLERGEVVVREQFAPGSFKDLRASGNGALKNIPVVIIVNGGSASASEILAGALRDMRGTKIVGEKTFGKGTVQEVESLKDGSSLKISVAEWLTPGGGKINKIGITPDFEIKLTDEDAEKKKDPQLDKALEILKEEIKKSAPRLIITPIFE